MFTRVVNRKIATGIHAGKNSLKVEWTAASYQKLASNTPSDFHYLWLRDNCQCWKCIHPSTRQKCHSTGDVSVSNTLKAELLNSKELKITWSNDFRDQGQHDSIYSLNWLLENSYSPSYRNTLFRSHHGVELWDESSFSKQRLDLPYEDLISKTSTSALRLALDQIKKFGLCFISDTPTKVNDELSAVEVIAKRFGYVRETFYGKTFDVINVTDAKNIAYTSLHLGLHMDLLYLSNPPGLQYLHSIENTVTGGDSTFLDSFKAVSLLSPKQVRILKETPIVYHYKNNNHYMHYIRPVIEDSDNEPMCVNYAPPFQGPALFKDPDTISDFHEAFKAFEKIINNEGLLYKTRLRAGQTAIFANRRVLHGRLAFDAGSGSRYFKGVYTDWDDFKDLERMIR